MSDLIAFGFYSKNPKIMRIVTANKTFPKRKLLKSGKARKIRLENNSKRQFALGKLISKQST